MKLKIFLSILIASFVILSNTTATAQSLAPNTFILQPYIGAPNMKKWLFDQEYQQGNSSKGFGHVGLSGEITLSSRFGFGFDAIYTPFSRVVGNINYDYDTTSGSTVESMQPVSFKEDKLRVLAKVFIHFNIDNPNWDIYLSGGVGANIIFSEARIDGEKVNYHENFINTSEAPIFAKPFPFSGRICFGTRYFFSDHFGINFEAGVGGPPFSFGMNVRF